MLAGDNGQTTKDKSASVVLASDHPAVPVTITNASVDLTVDIDASNLATHADALAINTKQTDGGQKTQIVGSGAASLLPNAVALGDADGNPTTTTIGAALMSWTGAIFKRLLNGVVGPTSTLTGFLNTLPLAVFNTTPPTRTTGQGGSLEADAKGNLRISEQAPPAYENVADAVSQCHEKPATSAAFNAIPYDIVAKATNGIIKAAPGNLYRLYASHDNVAAQTFAILNKATAPANGDTAVMYFKVPPATTVCIDFKFGKRFSIGIAWAYVGTTMGGTITLGAAEAVVNAECS